GRSAKTLKCTPTPFSLYSGLHATTWVTALPNATSAVNRCTSIFRCLYHSLATSSASVRRSETLTSEPERPSPTPAAVAAPGSITLLRPHRRLFGVGRKPLGQISPVQSRGK